VGSDAQWRSCARAVGLPDLANDEGLSTNAGRLAARELIVKEFSSALRTESAATWLRKLGDAGVPTAVVKTVREVTTEARGSAISGMPPAVAGGVRFPPPRLDEHGGVIRHSGWRVFDLTFGQTDGQ
jgi:crotonobetainyl-CoA:carnitine CoA-transferase CaiB-like acyl-CoA transferase